MPSILDINMKDFHNIVKREKEYMREWERQRVIKKCRECGQPYSYERGGVDPKECQSCRGEEGELIL